MKCGQCILPELSKNLKCGLMMRKASDKPRGDTLLGYLARIPQDCPCQGKWGKRAWAEDTGETWLLMQCGTGPDPGGKWRHQGKTGEIHIRSGVCFVVTDQGQFLGLDKHTTVLGLHQWLSSKEPACQCQRHKSHGFDPWVGKIPQRRAWQPTPVFVPRESPRTEEPGGLSA